MEAETAETAEEALRGLEKIPGVYTAASNHLEKQSSEPLHCDVCVVSSSDDEDFVAAQLANVRQSSSIFVRSASGGRAIADDRATHLHTLCLVAAPTPAAKSSSHLAAAGVAAQILFLIGRHL